MCPSVGLCMHASPHVCKTLIPVNQCVCACLYESDQHGQVGTSGHAAIRVHLGRIATVQERIRTRVRTRSAQPEAQNQQVGRVGLNECACANPKGNSSWSQYVDESNCQWRAACSWGPAMVRQRVCVSQCFKHSASTVFDWAMNRRCHYTLPTRAQLSHCYTDTKECRFMRGVFLSIELDSPPLGNMWLT